MDFLNGALVISNSENAIKFCVDKQSDGYVIKPLIGEMLGISLCVSQYFIYFDKTKPAFWDFEEFNGFYIIRLSDERRVLTNNTEEAYIGHYSRTKNQLWELIPTEHKEVEEENKENELEKPTMSFTDLCMTQEEKALLATSISELKKSLKKTSATVNYCSSALCRLKVQKY